jgi:hypothetical protein
VVAYLLSAASRPHPLAGSDDIRISTSRPTQ